MSHFFAAAFTGTHIGKVEIFPKNTPEGIHLGSVETQQLGLFRGFIVGSAPFLVGLGLLVWISSTLKASGFKFQVPDLLKLYLFFTMANSLFPSWVDFKHALPLVAVGVILGVAFFAIGVQPIISPDSFISGIFSRLQAALAWSVGINIAATGLVWGANKLL